MLRKKKKKVDDQGSRTVKQFVGFQVGEELYGVGIDTIQEIDRMHSITKLPKSLPFIEGVINLRGKIIPVIDVAKRFGLPPVEEDRRTRIIIALETARSVFHPESAIEPAPAMAFSVDQRYVDGVGRIKGGLLIILNLDLLLSVEEMSQLQQQTLS